MTEYKKELKKLLEGASVKFYSGIEITPEKYRKGEDTFTVEYGTAEVDSDSASKAIAFVEMVENAAYENFWHPQNMTAYQALSAAYDKLVMLAESEELQHYCDGAALQVQFNADYLRNILSQYAKKLK